MVSSIVVLALALAAPNTAETSLKDIWAQKMPGTKDIAELEPNAQGNIPKADRDRPLAMEISEALHYQIGKEPAEGFIVQGAGKSALQTAHDVLTNKQKHQSKFSDDSELSVIFFSYQFGAYVHLESVKESGKVIEIRYRFVPHETKEVTDHFAIIPLGKLEPGKYRVDIIRDRSDEKPVEAPAGPGQDWENKIVCKSFEFSVNNGK